jgi:O-antigen/teichoic acid export membrane protein
MLLVGLLLSQALAPHVARHLEEKNKEAIAKVVNLTDEAKRSV